MTYRVELSLRAVRDLRRIYTEINAANSTLAQNWFTGLEAAVLGLETFPLRHAVAPEKPDLRHLLYHSRTYVYRIIYAVDEDQRCVKVLHIRHGARSAL
ncbi:MAG: type II toxin-antitoxin system RelE/ParE family toxin [Asticcacaulis sp.]